MEFQLRSGAIGGNPVSVAMDRSHSYVNSVSSSPLADLMTEVTINSQVEASVQYFANGTATSTFDIPAGQAFHIQRIDLLEGAGSDSNGNGQARVVINGTVFDSITNNTTGTCVHASDSLQNLNYVIVDPSQLGVVISNSSEAWARFSGDVF